MIGYYQLKKKQGGFFLPFNYRDDSRDDGFAACTSYTGPVAIGDVASTVTAASPGTGITVANGTYTGAYSWDGDGSAGAPIVIRAETPGGVEFTDNGRVDFSGTYMTMSGFHWSGGALTQTNGLINISSGFESLRITNCKFHDHDYASTYSRWLILRGDNTRFDHNEIYNKSDIGEMVRVHEGQLATGLQIDHNHFHDFSDAGGNGAETIRFGTSGANFGSISCTDNFFEKCSGETEVHTVKGDNVTISRNTYLNCWDHVTFRECTDGTFSDNFVIVTQDEPQGKPSGVRLFGPNHTITNNNFSGCRRGILLGAGSTDEICYVAVTSSTCTGNRFTNSQITDLDSNWNYLETPSGCSQNDVATSGNTVSDNSGSANIDNARNAKSSDIGVKW